MDFREPLWLLGLIVIPLLLLIQKRMKNFSSLEAFIDRHLIPYLIIGKEQKGYFRLFPLMWVALIFALAGPRWSYKEVEVFTSAMNLVIVLDLSESMDADDIKPTRLIVAKQKIEDLLRGMEGGKVGLVAFAADPHMIFPMTEDKQAIRKLLSSLTTDVVYRQGSHLESALTMAESMLEREPGTQKSILVISDGGFDGARHVKFKTHTLGLGTMEGSPLRDKQGALRKKNGVPVISRLQKDQLLALSKKTAGQYFEARDEIDPIIEKGALTTSKKEKIWEEEFYLFLLPTLPLFYLWFRRGYIYLLLFLPLFDLSAFFKNNEQRALELFENGDFTNAAETFYDPYQKGVSYYRAGDYEKAAEMFQEANAPYNLGNAFALQMTQESLQKAAETYRNLLKLEPDHIRAKENLEIIEKLLKKEEQDKQDEQDSQEEECNMKLDRIENHPKDFMKNKFYIESMKTREEVDPW